MARGPTVTTRSGRASFGKARFSSSVDAWVMETEKRLNAVFRLSTQKVIQFMQDDVPYRDGFLRASLVVQVNQDVPKADRTASDGLGPYNEAYMKVAITGAVAGDRITAGYTMVYANRLEYGFVGTDSLGRNYNQPPRGWTRKAVARWNEAVRAATAEAIARSPSKGQ